MTVVVIKEDTLDKLYDTLEEAIMCFGSYKNCRDERDFLDGFDKLEEAEHILDVERNS